MFVFLHKIFNRVLELTSPSKLEVHIGSYPGAESSEVKTKIGKKCKNDYCDYILSTTSVRPIKRDTKYTVELPQFNIQDRV